MSHPGIRLRVTTPAGVVLEGDSDFLHYAAAWAHGIAEGEWQKVIEHGQDGVPLLVIELMPVTLEDTIVPDDLSALGDDT